MDYTGCSYLNETQAAQFYSNELDLSQFCENQYLIINNDVYCYQNGKTRRINFPTISSDYSGCIKPLNIEQRAAIDMLQDDRSTVKLITGTWGTGKTKLLSAQAISSLEEGKYDKIVFIRNNVQVSGTDAMGAIPGDKDDKMLPYVMPLADHCGGVDGVIHLIESGRLEILPLAWARGRNLENSIIFCTEAENLSKEHIQLIIARAAKGSVIYMDADCRQRDKVLFEKSKGIETMVDRLKNQKLFACVHLLKSERSETAALADLLNG